MRIDFRPEFVDAIKAGTKTQTVRAYDPARGRKLPRAGEKLFLFTGSRLKPVRFGEAVIERVLRVEFTESRLWWEEPGKFGGNVGTDSKFASDFAARDGFASFAEMLAWFRRVHGLPALGTEVPMEVPFEGIAIRWKEFEPAEPKATDWAMKTKETAGRASDG